MAAPLQAPMIYSREYLVSLPQRAENPANAELSWWVNMFIIPKVVALAKTGAKTARFALNSPTTAPGPTAYVNLTEQPFPVTVPRTNMTVADILPTLQDVFPNCKFSHEESWTQENAYTKRCVVTITIDWS